MEYEFRNKLGVVYLKVRYDHENQWLYNQWIGYATEQEIKEGAERFFYSLKKSAITQILNDNREQTGPWQQVNDWLEKKWMPRASAAGLQQFAHVMSPGISGALSAQDMHRRTFPFFEMKLFGDIESASEWLKSKQTTIIAPPESCLYFNRMA